MIRDTTFFKQLMAVAKKDDVAVAPDREQACPPVESSE
ncbi:hypothetical protein X738_27945 [Mesorhizobium sp. LNHC209A00]|nr:hypothetical protein X738_27945 [Mesorhizobium sp. LNHC209A00]